MSKIGKKIRNFDLNIGKVHIQLEWSEEEDKKVFDFIDIFLNSFSE